MFDFMEYSVPMTPLEMDIDFYIYECETRDSYTMTSYVVFHIEHKIMIIECCEKFSCRTFACNKLKEHGTSCNV